MLQNGLNFGQSGKVTRALPSFVTLLGLALGLAGLRLWPSPVGLALVVLGWACDGADGYLARRLGAVTPWGSRLDLQVDVALAWMSAALLARLHPAWCVLVLPLVLVQVVARAEGPRVSGRSVMTVTLVALGVTHAS